MITKRVSVVIPVYNVATYLQEAVTSALSQNYSDVEMVVVNDGSHEEASRVIRSICAMDSRISLIEQSNMMQALARHAGMKAASGEYILFLDADDVLLPGAISHLVSTLEAHPEAIAAYGTKVVMDREGNFAGKSRSPDPQFALSGNVLPALLQGWPILSNGSVCIRKTAISRVEFPSYAPQIEDWVTWCRLAALGDIIYAGDRTVLGIRMHEQRVSNQVFRKPSLLFPRLKMVYHDKKIIELVGKDETRNYHLIHKRNIHQYLSNNFRERGWHIRALKHKMLAKLLDARLPGKIRVLHVVKCFYAGGAERLVSSILEYSDKQKFEHIIVSLSDENERLQDVQRTLGIPYKSFTIMHEKNNIIHYLKCFFFIMKMRPDVIKTWLPPGNITGGIIGKILRIPVIWGIHNANPHTTNNKTQFNLSRYIPKRIVCCSQAVYDVCRDIGYDEKLLHTITNGTDTQKFNYSQEGRERVRRELGISDDTLLIGMAAEGTPIKRHNYFLSAARVFLKAHPNTRFLFCGKFIDSENRLLNEAIDLYGIRNNIYVLGIRNDMPDIFSALDIHCLTSESESFGLSVTEAMACKTLCIATNVGIIRDLLTDVGYIIEVTRNPDVLANAWQQCIDLPASEKFVRLQRGRNRVIEHYSITRVAEEYDSLFRAVVGPAGRYQDK